MKSPFKKPKSATDATATPEESTNKKIKLGKANTSKPKDLGKSKIKIKGKKVGAKPKSPLLIPKNSWPRSIP